jgi:hypothetical protein
MIAKARLLQVENVKGNAKASGKPFDMEIGHFLDLESFDKMRLMLPSSQVEVLRPLHGKDGVLSIGFDARTEKLTFIGFKVAA